MKRIILTLIHGYQRTGRAILLAISPVPSSCAFVPSCSEYCAHAVERYGVVRGLWRGFRRIMRCWSLSSRNHVCDPA